MACLQVDISGSRCRWSGPQEALQEPEGRLDRCVTKCVNQIGLQQHGAVVQGGGHRQYRLTRPIPATKIQCCCHDIYGRDKTSLLFNNFGLESYKMVHEMWRFLFIASVLSTILTLLYLRIIAKLLLNSVQKRSFTVLRYT